MVHFSRTMPYLLITSDVVGGLPAASQRLHSGPTVVGDVDSDPKLMGYLSATKDQDAWYYESPHCARVVLNKLEEAGWKMVTSGGKGELWTWTLHKECC